MFLGSDCGRSRDVRGRSQAETQTQWKPQLFLRGGLRAAWPFRTPLVEQRGLVLYRSVLTRLWICALLGLGRGAWPWVKGRQSLEGADGWEPLVNAIPSNEGTKIFILDEESGWYLTVFYVLWKECLSRNNFLEILFCYAIMEYSLLTQYSYLHH